MQLSAIYHELNFWKGFVKTERFLKGWVGNGKTPELNQEVADFILSVPHENVLDVGSGVVSILNGLVPVDSFDPLGELYQFVFDYKSHGLKHPIAVLAEEIYINELYDIVHISNALDHTQDPFTAYNRLMDAVKPGGYLIVQGFENEATAENWQGFHQWNISVVANSLKITGKETEQYFYNPFKVIKINFEQKTWFIWIIQK